MVDTFKDYKNQDILLDASVWQEHIKVDHSEMTKELIAEVLVAPSVVCESQHKIWPTVGFITKGLTKIKKGRTVIIV